MKQRKAHKKLTTSASEVTIAVLLALSIFTGSHAADISYTTSYTYDANGNIETRTTPNGAVITYSHDEFNRLDRITYPAGKSVEYDYDGNGNRIEMREIDGTTTKTTDYVYDRFNKLREVWYPGINPVLYQYDKAGHLTGITYPSGETVTYEIDGSYRLKRVIDGSEQPTVYDYDNNDTTVYLKKKTLPNGSYTTYDYDAAKRITDVSNKKSDGSVIDSYHYDFDANGNRTKVIATSSGGTKTIDYVYDNLNRLKEATCSDGTYERYTYGSSGNRLTKTTQSGTIAYDYDQDNRLLKAGNTAFFYDNNGNLTRKVAPTKTVDYGYDVENRLISHADGTTTVTYEYDGDGNRTAKTVNGITTKYVNDIQAAIPQVLLETNGQNNVTARYVYAPDGRVKQVINNSASYYLYDNPGRSVTALVATGQTVQNSYAYSAFGEIKTANKTVANDFKYAGEQYDEETGLIYLRKRYYDPETGRFISKDAYPGQVEQPQTINPYPYTRNNPVNRVDPLGLADTSGLPDLGAQPYLQNTQYIHWGNYDRAYYDAVNATKTFINAFSNTLDNALGFIKGAPSVINPQKIWDQINPMAKPADACQ